MHLSRRQLICGGLASACCLHGNRTHAQDDDIVLCSTDETTVQDDLAISDFAAGESSLAFEARLRAFHITDFGTAMARERWRKGDGLTPDTGMITLGCCFLSGSPAERAAVEKAARGWLAQGIGEKLSFDFDAPRERSQIRIFIGPGGNNSRIGRQALQVSRAKATLNLTNLRTGTIQHEFGHALGLLHEHLNSGFPVRFQEDVVIAEMAGPPNNWSLAVTRRNILDRFGKDARCVGDPAFNRDSVMMYEVPGRWTVGGQSFHRADRIHPRDLACVRGIYSA